MADVLVTGGAGFIGSHLVDALLAAKKTVVVVDDFSTGRRENLAPEREGLTIVPGDLRDADVFRAIGRAHRIDTIFHLAAVASVAQSVEKPMTTLSVNLAGSLRLAIWAARELPDVRRFVFASSAAVYGSRVPVPTREEAPSAPESPYGIEKATVERYLSWLSHDSGLQTACARFFNVFGPRQDPSSPYSGVLSILAKRVRDGQRFTLHGDGLQSRDFVFVADVVAALMLLADEPSAVGGTYNVGTGQEQRLVDVIDEIERVAGQRLQVERGDPRPGDILRSAADSSALRALGWTPTWSFADGLSALLGAGGSSAG